jgi:NADH-quinone oxidoreductase subunit M
MFGKIENPKNENLHDLNLREVVTFVPLIILAVWIGIYPTPFLNRLNTSVDRVIARVSPQYLQQNATAKAADCEQKVPPSKWQTATCGPDEAAPAAGVTGTVPADAPSKAAPVAQPAPPGAPKVPDGAAAPAGATGGR